MNHRRITAMILVAILSGAMALLPPERALAQGAPGTIETVAGGAVGDGLPATDAVLSHDHGVTTDADGNVYISDTLQNRVRVVNMQGTPITVLGVTVQPGAIETVAGKGDGTWGIDGEGDNPRDDLGDGGPATAATLYHPVGLVVDGAGSLFIADAHNYRLRKVDTGGTITTAAGGGSSWEDGIPATNAALGFPADVAVDGDGNLYIAEEWWNRIRLVNMQGTQITKFGVTVEPGCIRTVAGTGVPGYNGQSGPAISMQLDSPAGLAVDSAGENLYIADTENDRIRRVDASGNLTTVRGGNCPNPPCVPVGIALRSTTELFFTDRWECRVARMWDSNGDTLVTSADDPPDYVVGTGDCGLSGDGGPAISAQISLPHVGRIDVDTFGNLYIADRNNLRVREVTPGADGYIDGDPDDIIDTVAGGGGPLGQGGPATSASIGYPADLDHDAAGNLYIADTWDDLIRKVTAGSDGMVAGGADAPNEIITTAVGGGSGCVGQENPIGDGCAPTEAILDYPCGVTLDSDGNIFIADAWHQRVRVVNAQDVEITVANVTIPAGKIDTVAGNGDYDFGGDEGPATSASFRNPVDIALDPAGNLYIADRDNHRVRRVDNSTGVITTVAGSMEACAGGEDGIAATGTDLCEPTAVLLDSAGNLLIADHGHLRVRRVDAGADHVVDGAPDEVIITVAGLTAGQEICPEKLNDVGDRCAARQAALGVHAVRDIALDSSGNLYISHPDPDLVRQVVPGANGIIDGGSDELIHTVVYSMKGPSGYRGDGGMACAAASRWPNGLLIQPDPSQPSVEHMYIADDWNHRIRRAEAPLHPDPDEDGLYTCLGYPSELDLGTDPFNPDNDGDGCLDGEEAEGASPPKPGSTGAYDPLAWYDFYDVPIPANADPTPNGAKNQAVAMDDVLGVLFYVGTYDGDGGSPNANGVAYDSVKGSCDADGDTVADDEGVCYDRSPGTEPNPPWEVGPPDTAVAMDDVLAVLAQVGLSCIDPP